MQRGCGAPRLAKIGEAKGLAWLQNHLDYCTTPLLNEPWVLDMDSTVKTLYAHQEGAEVGYNPHKPGRPSHAYHTYMLSSLRLILRSMCCPATNITLHMQPMACGNCSTIWCLPPPNPAARRQVVGHRESDGAGRAK